VSVFWRPKGCLLWFDFGEPEVDVVYDLSGKENNGTIYGARRVSGALSGALSLDGVDDRVGVPDAPPLDITNSFTIEAFLRSTGLGDVANPWLRIVDKAWNVGYVLCLAGAAIDVPGRRAPVEGALAVALGDGVDDLILGGTTSIRADGRWHHGVGVFTGTEAEPYYQAQIWLDGVLENTLTYTVLPVANPYPLTIGCNMSTAPNAEWFEGDIALVRIYSRALPEEEIKAHHSYLVGPMARVPE